MKPWWTISSIRPYCIMKLPFMHDMLKRAQETCHTTSREAGEIAKLANVKHLLIGHYSARYKNLIPLLEEAQAVFPAAELALEGSIFTLKDYA